MNRKQWIGLLMIYISYLLLGATIFYFIEFDTEKAELADKKIRFIHLTKHIELRFGNDASEFASNLTDFCGQPIDLEKGFNDVGKWNFYNSFFFVVTVVSTIGYGNLHPTTDPGRIFMILYATVGIPLNGILLSSLGQFFGAVFTRAHQRYKKQLNYGARWALAIHILTYLIPGLIIFIFLPAGMFCIFENWDYVEAVYFAFVTLTTIGFGDLVAGQQDDPEGGAWLLVYKILLICWVIFGLGYLIMLLGFVAQAMKNKKIVQLEEKLMAGLTHSRIWHGFAKDITHLRRLMNEVYLDKFKPVFREKTHVPPNFGRSHSLPDLARPFSDEEEAMRKRWRQRAMSAMDSPRFPRVHSDTDLQNIDVKATFASSAIPATMQLVNTVFQTFSEVPMNDWSSSSEEQSDNDLRGFEGFTDEEVLATEEWMQQPNNEKASSRRPSSRRPSSIFNGLSYEDTVSRQPHRGRAMSECPNPDINPPTTQLPTNPSCPVDWTWSGPNANKLHDIIKQRNKQRMLMGLNKGRKPSLSAAMLAGAKKMNPMKRRRRCVTENNSEEALGQNNGDVSKPRKKNSLSVPEELGRKRLSLQETHVHHDSKQYLTTTAGQNSQLTSDLHKLYSKGGHVFNSGSRREMLEDDSILPSFLLLLSDLHSQVGERLVTREQEQAKPRRKMGTASLTPPRIRSLLELFPDPTAQSSPRMSKKMKSAKASTPSTSEDTKKTKNMSVPPLSSTEEVPPSNLKRLGRFLLRSYSIVPKDTEDGAKPQLRKKRFSLWPSDSDSKELPFQLQVDSPSEVSRVSEEVVITIDSVEPSSGSASGQLFPPASSLEAQTPSIGRQLFPLASAEESQTPSSGRHPFPPPNLQKSQTPLSGRHLFPPASSQESQTPVSRRHLFPPASLQEPQTPVSRRHLFPPASSQESQTPVSRRHLFPPASSQETLTPSTKRKAAKSHWLLDMPPNPK